MAVAAVCASLLFFVAIAPFADTALPQVAAFIPIYQTALITNDLITAINEGTQGYIIFLKRRLAEEAFQKHLDADRAAEWRKKAYEMALDNMSA